MNRAAIYAIIYATVITATIIALSSALAIIQDKPIDWHGGWMFLAGAITGVIAFMEFK